MEKIVSRFQSLNHGDQNDILVFQVLEVLYSIHKLGIGKVLPMHRPLMLVQMRFSFKSFETNVTNIWPFICMNSFVHF